MLFVATGDLRVKAYELLAKICIEKDKMEEAIKFYKNALKYTEEVNPKQKAIIYNTLGLLHYSLKDLDESMRYQELCLKTIESYGDKNATAKTLRNLGRIYTLKGDHVQALRSHQKSLELKRIVGHSKKEAEYFETLGQDFEFAGQLAEAISEYGRAFIIYQELGLEKEMKRANMAIETFQQLLEEEEHLAHSNTYDLQGVDFL